MGGDIMLSLRDCLDFVDMDSATIEVIAQHQHLSDIVAAELGNELIKDLRGIHAIHLMHRELIAHAAEQSNLEEEQRLRKLYTAFSRKYPMPSQF
jgi:hypothetical protein